MTKLVRITRALDGAACRSLVARAEEIGFKPTCLAYPRSYRSNDRLVIDDPMLAAMLYERLRASLPASIEGWSLAGLNERFRFCRYRDGQHFVRHRDGAHWRGRDHRSFLTFMIYLSDGDAHDGGATRFYLAAGERHERPAVGDALVFDHSAWHDGEAVHRGTKYVMRSDVMYRRAETKDDDGHLGYVWRLLADRDAVFSAGRDGTVRRWSSDMTESTVVRRHRCSVHALAVDHNGRLWSGSRDGELRNERSAWQTNGGAILSLAAWRRGIAIGSADGVIRHHCAGSEHPWRAHDDWVWAVAARDGRLASAAEDGTVSVWRAPGDALHTFHVGVPLRSLIWHGTELLAGGADGTVFRLTSQGLVARHPIHGAAVRALALLPDGRVASAGEDETVCLWSLAGIVDQRFAHGDFVTSLSVRDGCLWSASYDGRIRALFGRTTKFDPPR
jgi:predicted 2-oxoglutarate/Fe(II)-dependent dioxygenase YbiX